MGSSVRKFWVGMTFFFSGDADKSGNPGPQRDHFRFQTGESNKRIGEAKAWIPRISLKVGLCDLVRRLISWYFRSARVIWKRELSQLFSSLTHMPIIHWEKQVQRTDIIERPRFSRGGLRLISPLIGCFCDIEKAVRRKLLGSINCRFKYPINWISCVGEALNKVGANSRHRFKKWVAN